MNAKTMTPLVDTALGCFSLQELNNGTLYKPVTKMGLKHSSIPTPILFKNSSLTLVMDYVAPSLTYLQKEGEVLTSGTLEWDIICKWG